MCVNLGYGRKEIAQEIAKQCEKLPYFSPWFSTAEPSALLAKKLASLTPKDLNTVFFTTCGSTALDSAVRFVHYYFNCINKSEKKTIIAREKAIMDLPYFQPVFLEKKEIREFWIQ